MELVAYVEQLFGNSSKYVDVRERDLVNKGNWLFQRDNREARVIVPEDALRHVAQEEAVSASAVLGHVDVVLKPQWQRCLYVH